MFSVEYSKSQFAMVAIINLLSRATFPGAPSYGGVRTWVEGSQVREASNHLGYKEYTQLFDTSSGKTLYRLYPYLEQ